VQSTAPPSKPARYSDRVRSSPDNLQQAVGRAVGAMLPEDGLVLVACSGGADSVALASAVAREPRLRCAVGHVDHGLRPESAREAEGVRASLGVPFFVERLSGLPRGRGLEAGAREARYPALKRLAAQSGASVVATAHTRRDQAETVLLRLARGAGPGALGGVRARRALAPGIELVRPLLEIPRSATELFCRQHGLPFVNDPHNLDPARARAQVRLAWPVLGALNPRLEEALAGTARLLADEDDFMGGLARSALLSLATPRGLDAHQLAALHPALQRRCLILAALAEGLRPERGHLESLRLSLRSPRFSISLPGGRAAISSGSLSFHRGAPRADAPPAPEVAVAGPGSYAWRSRHLAVVRGELGEGTVVDLERAPFPWTLRGHRPGDRFRPGSGRTRKVSDLWIDARLPRERRGGLAVLQDAAGIVFWVEGVREGEASRGGKAAPASFVLSAEMDVETGGLG
jgi:tRNA(Ile)-lysidine synthase